MSLDRPYILNTLLEIVACFANQQRQEQAWLWGKGSWNNDFAETCCLLGDKVDVVFDEYRLYGISDRQYHMLKKLYDDICDFPESNPHIFLETPEWQKIRKDAQDILDSFHYRDSVEP